MTNGVLLWTERPERLPREEETHAWMEAEHPEEKYDLELRFENRPGDWTEYSRAFHRAWNRASELGVPLYNLESDIVPTHEAFRVLMACKQRCCTVPYQLVPIHAWSAMAYRSDGYGTCQVEPIVEEWAIGADLGFVKFGATLVREMPIDVLPHLTANWQCLNAWLFEYLRTDPFYRKQTGPGGKPKWPTGTLPPILHLHWLKESDRPGLRSNHDHWDEGDMRHHRTRTGEDGTVLRMREGEDNSPRPSIPFQRGPFG